MGGRKRCGTQKKIVKKNEDVPRENDYENPEHPEDNLMDVADLPPIEGVEFIREDRGP